MGTARVDSVVGWSNRIEPCSSFFRIVVCKLSGQIFVFRLFFISEKNQRNSFSLQPSRSRGVPNSESDPIPKNRIFRRIACYSEVAGWGGKRKPGGFQKCPLGVPPCLLANVIVLVAWYQNLSRLGGGTPLINLIGYLGLGWGVLGLRWGVPPMGGWVPPPLPDFHFSGWGL